MREAIDVPVNEAFSDFDPRDASGNPVTLPGYSEPGEMTPEVIEDYVFRPEIFQKIMASILVGKPFVLVGPSDSGKTSIINQVAARLNWNVWIQASSDETEVADMVGMRYLDDNGNMPFSYGPLVKAARNGDSFLLDEIDKNRPGMLAKFNAFFEGHPYIIDSNGGEQVVPDPDFFLMATSNTKFMGNTGGQFNAAIAQDQATFRRFCVIEVGYMEQSMEDKMLSTVVPDSDERKRMLDFANLIRKANFPVPFGTGMLRDWAIFTDLLASYEDGLAMVLTDRLEESQHIETLRSHFKTAMGREMKVG